MPGPVNEKRNVQARFITGGFTAGERWTVVADDNDEGISRLTGAFEFGQQQADADVNPLDAVIITCDFCAELGGIKAEEREGSDIGGTLRIGGNLFDMTLEGPMRIDKVDHGEKRSCPGDGVGDEVAGTLGDDTNIALNEVDFIGLGNVPRQVGAGFDMNFAKNAGAISRLSKQLRQCR